MKEAEEKAEMAQTGDFSFMLDEARRYTAMTDSDFEELAEERNEEGQAPRVFKVPTSSSPMEEEEEDLERHRRHHNGGLAGFFSRGHFLGSKKHDSKKW